GNDARLAHAGPEGLDAAGVALVARQCRYPPQSLGRILGIVGVVEGADFGLVRENVNGSSQAGELHRRRRNVVVADQNVLVLFLHQLVAWRHDQFDHVLAGGQHGGAVVRIGNADRAVRAGARAGRAVDGSSPGRRAGRRVSADDAGELVHAVVGRRLHLIPVVHAVIAFELRVVRNRMGRGATV